MQNIQYAHPYVDSVSMNGDQISLRVEVTDFKTTQGGIEISGQATQTGGAFAAFSQIVDIATATQEGEYLFVTVTADTLPPYRFRKDQDITIFVRVAKVWVTVLGEHDAVPDEAVGTDANAATMWDQVRRASQMNGAHWTVPASSGAGAAQPPW